MPFIYLLSVDIWKNYEFRKLIEEFLPSTSFKGNVWFLFGYLIIRFFKNIYEFFVIKRNVPLKYCKLLLLIILKF